MATPIDANISLHRLIQSISFSQFVLGLILLFVARLVFRGFYRVYFHPLSHFPGPKLCIATRIPYLVAIWRGDIHRYVAAIHNQYGDVVRISPDEVSFIDPQAWKDTNGYGASRSPNVKGSMPTKNWTRYTGSKNNGVTSMIAIQDPHEHSTTRRIFSPAFSERALKQQEPLFARYADQLLQVIKEAVDQDPQRKLDLVKLYNFTTFDVMGDLTFGESLHMLDSSEYDPWVANIFDNVRVGSRLGMLAFYPVLYKAFQALVPPKMIKARQAHLQHSIDRVTKRLEKGRESDGIDIWDLVLNKEEGKGLTRGEMDTNATLFMIAGTETTATLLSGVTWLLLKNPDKYEKLKKELCGTFASAQDFTLEKISGLPYLNAVLKEGMRRYPPVPIGMPRITAPDGSTIANHYVPPRTPVSVPHLAMYSSEKNFKRPLEYIPERWLGDEEFKDDAKHALQPFDVGSRDCLGKNMAWHSIRLILAKMVYSYDLELCPESEDWGNQQVFTLWAKPPLLVNAKPAKVA